MPATGEQLPLNVVLGCLAVVAALALMPSFLFGPPRGHSLVYNLVWLESFDAGIWRGEIYPRWLSGLWDGAGAPDFFFYAPLPFWLASTVGRVLCLTCGPTSLLTSAAFVVLAISGFGYWIFARRFFGDRAALLAAVLFVVMPYHLGVDWYVRQAFGEFAAYALLPLIAHFTLESIRNGSGGARLALCVAGLSLCHLPSVMVCAIAIALATGWYAARRSPTFGDGLAVVARVGGWASLGVLLGAVYWLPALTLLADVSAPELFRSHYVWSNWIFFDGSPEPLKSFAFPMKALLICATVVSCGAAYSIRDGKSDLLVWILLPVAVAWIFVTPVSWYAWSFVPPLQTIQFPWRFMQVLDLAAPLAIVVIAARPSQRTASQDIGSIGKARPILIASGVIAVLHLPFLPLVVSNSIWLTNSAQRESIVERLALNASVWEYLPAPAHDAFDRQVGYDKSPVRQIWPTGLRDVPRVQVAPAGTTVTTHFRTSRRWILAIDSDATATVTFKHLHWKHWRARILGTGRPVQLLPEPEFGLMTFQVPKGVNDVEIYLPLHASEWAGIIISATAGLLILILVLLARPRWRIVRRV